MRRGRGSAMVAGAVLALGLGIVEGPAPARADGTVEVSTSAEFIAAFEDPTTDEISLTAPITLDAEPTRPAGADALHLAANHRRLTAAAGAAAMAAAGATGDLTVDDLDITGASDSAIRWIGGRVTVRRSSMTFNTSPTRGGAISADGAPIVVISLSDISGNTAAGQGGAVWTTGDVEVVQSNIDDNTAGSGGAISNEDGSGFVTIERSGIVGNEATAGDGGAIRSATTVASSASSFEVNVAAGDGGAVYAPDGVEATASVWWRNRAASGGAIAGGSRVSLLNTTVAQNRATVAGGGVTARDVVLEYVTTVRNDAPTGADVASDGSGTLTSFGTVYDAPAGLASCSGLGTTTSQGWSLESGGDTCGLDASTDRTDAPDPMLGTLVDRVLMPQPGSILIDAISLAGCAASPGAVDVDQIGNPRPTGLGCDIGAAEAQPTTTPTTTPTTAPPSTTAPPTVPPAAPPATPVAGAPGYTG